MVFGERLDTFDESRKDLQEFQNASIEAMSLVETLLNGPPVYKYFPTKTYQRFVGAINRTRQNGMHITDQETMVLCVIYSLYIEHRETCFKIKVEHST